MPGAAGWVEEAVLLRPERTATEVDLMRGQEKVGEAR